MAMLEPQSCCTVGVMQALPTCVVEVPGRRQAPLKPAKAVELWQMRGVSQSTPLPSVHPTVQNEMGAPPPMTCCTHCRPGIALPHEPAPLHGEPMPPDSG